MKEYPDNHFDVVVTDPPYGIGEAAGKNKSRTKPFGSKYNNLERQTKEVKATDYGVKKWDNKRPNVVYFQEILRVSKNQVIFGGNYFADWFPASSCWIVWDKDNSGDFADCELAWTSFKTAVRLFKYRWNGMLQGNMKQKEKRVHPTQKPLPLMEWIIANYTKENDLILDPFMGSGTTGEACIRFNRKFVGIEREKHFFEIASARLEAAQNQLTF
jgi:site-specific DNA-methyltransferase (adenine-specific)